MNSYEADAIKKGVTAMGETLEAIIGAINTDVGYDKCKAIVLTWPNIEDVITEIVSEVKGPKTLPSK